MGDSAGLYRLALTYELADDGRLVAQDQPAALVPAGREGALYRHIAALADAPDTAIAAAASRYGPLGPVRPLPIPDRPLFLWSVDDRFRDYMRGIDQLHRWIATGGMTPIPGHVAASAHIVAAMAETDPVLAQRLIDLFTQDRLRELPDEERERLAQAYGVQEQVFFHAMRRRQHLLSKDFEKGDANVRVIPKPGTRPYLALAARYFQVLVAAVQELGTTTALIPPDSVGRVLTMLQPYVEQNLVPAETATAWREAATELQDWANILRARRTAGRDRISQWKALLILRLQQVDAWPYPSGQQLGAFGRALWTVWTRLVQQPPQRCCTWPHCATRLPPGAHGNRHYCDVHRREAPRLRSARGRQQARAR
jgi:hypothetical protein